MSHTTRSKTAAARAKEGSLAENLVKQIQSVIRHPKNNTVGEEPPFTPSELLVIALVVTQKALLPKDIIAWVLKRFKYYNTKCIEELASARVTEQHVSINQPHSIMTKLYAAFDSWQAPLFGVDKDEVVSSLSAKKNTFQIAVPSIGEAKIFLRKTFNNFDCPVVPHQKKHLLDLPAELKMIIFDMVLGFGYPGLAVTQDGYRVFRREDEHVIFSGGTGRFTLPPQALSLLCVSKQTYADALPSFLSNNMFSFSSVYDLAQFAQKEHRRKLLKRVCIKYKPDLAHMNEFSSAAGILSELAPLKTFELDFMDTWWIEPSGVNFGRALANGPQKIPGIYDLAFTLYQATNVKFHGQFPHVKEFLAKEISKIQAARGSKEVERLADAEMLKQVSSFKEAARFQKARSRTSKPIIPGSTSDPGSSNYDNHHIEQRKRNDHFDFAFYDRKSSAKDSSTRSTQTTKKKGEMKAFDGYSSKDMASESTSATNEKPRHSSRSNTSSSGCDRKRKRGLKDYGTYDYVDFGDLRSGLSSGSESSAKRRK